MVRRNSGENFFARIKKTRFDHLYDLPDCCAYYQALAPLDYQNPTHSVPIARAALTEISRLRRLTAPWVLDLACGYGAASALLRFNVDLHSIVTRYSATDLADLDSTSVIARDRAWYATHGRHGMQTRIAGMDVSRRALQYGLRVGLYDRTFADNLEANDPGPKLSRFAPQVSLILDTGAYGYIGARTFQRLLQAAGNPLPWIVTSPARVAECEPSFNVFEQAGLVLEQAPIEPFRHRRFASVDEQDAALSELLRKGISTSGLEDTGFYFAEAYIARPPNEAHTPLSELVRNIP